MQVPPVPRGISNVSQVSFQYASAPGQAPVVMAHGKQKDAKICIYCVMQTGICHLSWQKTKMSINRVKKTCSFNILVFFYA